MAHQIRVTVVAFAAGRATVRLPGGAAVPLAVRSPLPDAEAPVTAPMLTPGTQLNIINVRVREGELFAGFIIYEPDILLGVSEVAACFESYGTTPWAHLLHKLRPAETTGAILLGNLASQLLDEAVNHPDRDIPYADSVREFFRRNALAFAACDARGDLPSDFHHNAQRQRQHIRTALGSGLTALSGLDRERVVLEPSFVCEALGLQGRMDFLSDTALVEQKSGKGEWRRAGEGDPEVPVPQLTHRVQLALYQAVLRLAPLDSHCSPRADAPPATFLLYSRYAKSLVRQDEADDVLLHAALRLRNQIVWCERHYTTPDGVRLLDRLTPERLNTAGLTGRFWDDYIGPQLHALLDPIHAASPLERDYFYRMLRFVQTEYLLAKTGISDPTNPYHRECTGAASLWTATTAEKHEAGAIYDRLAVVEATAERVVLALPDSARDELANFRTGDTVVLYPHAEDAEPDARRTMLFRASVERLAAGRLTLLLRAPQRNVHVFAAGGVRWAVEHDFLDASFTSLYRGLHAFLCAPQERRDLLLDLREPQVDASQALVGSYGDMDGLVLAAKRARDLFLLVGPPGTGKTSRGLMNILREELASPPRAGRGEPPPSAAQTSVLLLAYTNRAVDEVCARLAEAGLDFVRLGRPLSCPEALHPHLLETRAAQCSTVREVRSLVATTRIFTATTATMASNLALLELKRFDLAIIDEASQILEPQLLPIFCDGRIRRFVMIGDHKQLPAVVQQGEADAAVSEPSLRAAGLTDCRTSLFERMLRTLHSPDCSWLLTRQGRMHRDIAAFPSRAFYGDRLEVATPAQTAPSPEPRVRFIDVRPDDDSSPADATSAKVNLAEADAIARIVADCAARRPDLSVGIIVPYRHQIAAVRRAIAERTQRADAPQSHGAADADALLIDTVERFQGSQRDVIIYGFTVRETSQLAFLTMQTFTDDDGNPIDRKLNVALTRARRYLYLVGNAGLLRQVPLFARLIDETAPGSDG